MKRIIHGWVKGLLAFSSLAVLSCAAIDPNPPTNPPGILYAIDKFNVAVYAFENALTINGAVAPTRTISGNLNSQIAAPTALAVDSIRDILYVADSSAQLILVFSPASTLNGDVTPIKVFPGVANAGVMFYDDTPGSDRLYVTDVSNGFIQAWDQISTLPTGTVPTRGIKLGYTPSGMVIDPQRNLLYVGDPAFQGVKTYGSISTLSTNINTNAAIKNSFIDASRPLQEVNGLTLNAPNNILFLTESFNIFSDDNNPDNDFSPSVEIFDQASEITGLNTAAIPARRVMGDATGLSVDTSQPHFFVADSQATLWVIVNNTTINVWNNANQIGNSDTENTAPTRSIQVSTANAQIVSFDVDLAH